MTNLSTNTPDFKIHKDKYIYASTYIGGPLAGGYILAENFKAFGETKKYWQTLVATFLFTIFLFTTVFLIPGFDKIPRFLIPLAYTILAYGLMRWLQGQQIDAHIANGGKAYSPWRATVITIISLVSTLLILLFVIFFILPDEKSEILSKKHGNAVHQIQFMPSHFEKNEVAILSDKLGEIQYLDSTYSMTLFVDKENDQIQIWVPFSEPAWTYAEDIKRHTLLKDILSEHYPKNQIIVNICDENWTIKKTIK